MQFYTWLESVHRKFSQLVGYPLSNLRCGGRWSWPTADTLQTRPTSMGFPT